MEFISREEYAKMKAAELARSNAPIGTINKTD
jgi:hypothetical protein